MTGNAFGKNLKELRLLQGLSQSSLGKTLHVSNQTVSCWESGCREPDFDMLLRIAKYFDVTIDELLIE